jgi:hypothetical protein
MINEEAWAAWMDALRSEEFVKSTGDLRNDRGYCCLGVACEVAARNGIIEPAYYEADGSWSYGGEHALLPEAVARWLGLPEMDGNVFLGEMRMLEYDGITEVNDKTETTFPQIADLLERWRSWVEGE